jgi:prepilin-type processing-associated H-X9-DG protein
MASKEPAMTWHRGRGSISGGELLVILGLIGLAGAALTPRTAEAKRERACMSNLRQVCLALQLYLDDYNDRLPPRETYAEVLDYFSEAPGRRKGGDRRGPKVAFVAGCARAAGANPYLRWPVALDSYVRTREVWRCPSALLEQGPGFVNPDRDWLGYLKSYEGAWGASTGLCPGRGTYPVGWGGAVTDSMRQGRPAARRPALSEPVPAGVFAQSIGVNTTAAGKHVRQLGEAATFVICGDGGAQVETFSIGTLAFPDICALECANEVCGWADWETCTWAADCGLFDNAPNDGSFLRNAELRRRYTRHNGGVNIGFLDGHAEWFDSEKVPVAWRETEAGPPSIRGVEPWGPRADCGFGEANPGVPTLFD